MNEQFLRESLHLFLGCFTAVYKNIIYIIEDIQKAIEMEIIEVLLRQKEHFTFPTNV